MKVACVTTTINVPKVLQLYRAYATAGIGTPYGYDVEFFVAGDLKTGPGCADFCNSLDNVFYLSSDTQKALGYRCSEMLGWNTLARRNIATLEALKFGADIIVLVDDDNVPMNEFYFNSHVKALTAPHSGIKVTGQNGWFDVGQFLDPIAPHRGYPHTKYGAVACDPIVGAKVGVNAGICMGDPDISAYFRIANHPTVHRASILLDDGVVVDPDTSWTVFNSQNTAFIRELAPAMFMMPGVGRYDDIYASLICQRVMRERDMHVKFGRPYIFQERNHHDLLKDLRAEIDGMENIVAFANQLDLLDLNKMSVIDAVRCIYSSDDILPTKSVQSAHAFLEDCEKIL